VVTAFDDGSRDEVILVRNRHQKASRQTALGLSEIVLRKFLFPSDEAMLWALDAARTAEPVVQQHRRVSVFSTFPPMNSHVAAWLLKRRFGVRWVADFRDPLVGSPGRQLTNAQMPLGAIPKAVDHFVQNGMFRDADAIVANTDVVQERWHREYPQIGHKLSHIWNGFDREDAPGAAPIPPRQRKMIAHVGSIYSGRHPVPLLRSMYRLIENGRLEPERFVVGLIGPFDWSVVPDREVFERLGALGCVETPGEMPHSQARQLMREADYLLLLDVIDTAVGQQIPSKVFEYIPIGRPIIAVTTRNSPTDRVLAGCGIPTGRIYPDSNVDEVDDTVLRILSTPSEPTQPSDWFLETFDAERRTRALAKLLDPCAAA
jgi:hypothetical protein